MILVEMTRLKVNFNKPIYVGMCILDISKTILYDFHYNYIKAKFNSNAKLLYTDTDSLIYQFFVDDIYTHIKEDIHLFDTSDYPSDNVYEIPQKNKKVLGLMKDENSGKIMKEFIGLRSKMYCFTLHTTNKDKTKKLEDLRQWGIEKKYLNNALSNFGIVKKAKGIRSSALKFISFNDYYECVFNNSILEVSQNYIRSDKHDVFTMVQSKTAVSPYDDKRIVNYIYTDTLPWGYND